ncbi:inhibin alpha chain precursor [Danio rerio]|uniref:Inhibin alpha chain n=1 Tax=Danio rerio TaxID=7955 RepID=Q1LYE4_DANRE|nr:inhibin alpha chain precursor [Danio rerio]|eukprot:NP_001038669.1 inhibin alpha chain precursor [Danio rerio]
MLTGTSSLSSFACALMLWALFSPPSVQACQGDELPCDMVLGWLKRRILEGLGLDEPPLPVLQLPTRQAGNRAVHHVASRMTRETRVERRHHQESSQVILFPSSESTCKDIPGHSSDAGPGHFTYYFQPSLDSQESIITSAHFWFYAGETIASINISAPLFILTHNKELLKASESPVKRSPDGWTTYKLDVHLHTPMADGQFMLQIRCPTCSCHDSEDKTPFLHLHTRSSGPDRSRRAPKIPWSPDAIENLKRPASQGTDCRREQIEISFEDLGWNNWIVHPKSFTFYYCHGNCSSAERITTILGITQCCAPVPESMKSLRFTTTSDGGYSFKYETLPNIIPEECNCI